MEEINAQIESEYQHLQGKQINVEYLAALQDVRIVCKTVTKSGFLFFSAEESTIDRCFRLGDATAEDVAFVANYSNDSSCSMVISNDTAKDGLPVFNAADDNFYKKGQQKENLSMRLWLRATVTVVPVVFLLLSLLIQNKKFIISEEYYDMMIEEIEKRKTATAE